MSLFWKDVLAYTCRRGGRQEVIVEKRHRLFPWRGRRIVIQYPDGVTLGDSADRMKAD